MTQLADDRPGPDHAAARTGLLASLPGRTFVQGLGVDLAVAGALVVYDAMNESSVDWRLLGLTLGKTLLMTAASAVMRRLKPPAASAL